MQSKSLAEVQRRVARVHREADLGRQLHGYNGWAPEYEQVPPRRDVAVLQYRAPELAAACLASMFQGPLEDVLVLDVACGTGLVAQELQTRGFRHFHGLDGSQGMLEHARHKGLYQDLKQCVLGQGVLPAPTGGYLCLTTRSNQSNLPYKAQLEQLLADLEQQGLWEKVTVQEVEQWERSTAEQGTGQGSCYISGVVYLYQKKPGPG
ncbi:hypothetical protein lerEdw1_004867 [Lerista edwardsae]|nr:hypothetical protein lerEdw1_004867 [Lerista edwardsae]